MCVDDSHEPLADASLLDPEELTLRAGRLGSALTDRGRAIEFDKLALTVGARPRIHDVAGACALRDLDDAVDVRGRFGAVAGVVIGGGYKGLESAAVARKAGKTNGLVLHHY